MKFISKLAALSLVFVASLANALQCDGVPTALGLSQGGEVTLALGSGPMHMVCSVQTQGSYSTGIDACKEIYRSLKLAKATGKSQTLFYNTTSYTCASFPSWGQQTSFYYYMDY